MFSRFSTSAYGMTNKGVDTSSQRPNLLVPFVHMKFNNNLDNEGSSGTVATGVNPVYNTDKKEGTHSIKFTGSTNASNYVYFQDDMPTPNWTGITIGFWIKPISTGFITSTNTHVFTMYSNNDNYLKMYLVQLKENVTKFRVGGNANSYFNIPANTWSHLTITGNAARRANVYINGVISRVVNGLEQFLLVPQNFISELKIGHHVAATFNGRIDDFRIYDFEMTAAQALELYNNTI